MFWHPHGSAPEASRMILIKLAMNVPMAAPKPRLPILPAITSSFFISKVYSGSGVALALMIPETVEYPTAMTTALPTPV